MVRVWHGGMILYNAALAMLGRLSLFRG